MTDINKAQLLRHIAKSDLTAVEKRYLEGLVGAEDCNKVDSKVQIVTELNPCPFCGSTTAPTVMNQNEAQWLYNDAENLSMVVCCAAKKFGCGASTGFCDTAEQAVEAWNRRASDWIPCSERMPENGQRVLIRSSSNRFFDVIYHSDIQYPNFTLKIFGHTYAWDYRDVISWKPLPYPPEEGGDP
jgi:hypothetical protein